MSNQRGLLDALLGVAYEDTPEGDRAARLEEQPRATKSARGTSIPMSNVGLLGGLLGLLEEEQEQQVTPIRRKKDDEGDDAASESFASPGPDGQLLRSSLDDDVDLGPSFVFETSLASGSDELLPPPSQVAPAGETEPELPPPGSTQPLPPPGAIAPPPSAGSTATRPPAQAPASPVALVPPAPMVPDPPMPVGGEVATAPGRVTDVPPPPVRAATVEVPPPPIDSPSARSVGARQTAQLADELASFETARRREALRGLLGHSLARDTAMLVARSLADPDVDVRHLALQVLERAPELIPVTALQGVVYDSDPSVRSRAMALAGRTGDPKLLATIAARLADEIDRAVFATGIEAMASLARTGNLTGDDVDDVCCIVGGLTTRQIQALESDLRVLALALRTGDIIARLDRDDARVRVGAAVLASSSDIPDALAALARLVDDEESLVRQLASEAITRSRADSDWEATGEPAAVRSQQRSTSESVESALLPGLIDALADPQKEIRAQAASALARLPREDVTNWIWTRSRSADADLLARLVTVAAELDLASIAQPIADAILRVATPHLPGGLVAAAGKYAALQDLLQGLRESSDPSDRIAHVRLAGLLAAPEIDPIDHALDDSHADVRLAAVDVATVVGVVDRLADRLGQLVEHDGSSRVRVAALTALRELSSHGRVAAARHALHEGDSDLRMAALELLDPNDDAQFALLAGALRDAEKPIAERAAEVCKARRSSDGLAVLWGQLRHADGHVRALAVDILSDLAPEALRRVASQAVTSADETERVTGLIALAGLQDGGGLAQVIEALGDPAPAVRIQALETLGHQNRAFPVDPVVGALRDPDAAVRCVAVRVAAAIEDDQLLPHLVASLDDPSSDVRRAGRQSLRSHPSPKLVELLARELDHSARRSAAAELLARRGGAALDIVVQRIEAADDAEREVLVGSLRAAGVVERLLSDLSAARPERRAVAMRLLTIVRDASVVDAVAQRLSDPDPSLRAAAADLLGELGDRSAIEPLRMAFGSDPDMDVVAAIERAYRRLAEDD